MILDTLENFSLYTSLHPGLQQFFDAFQQCSPAQYPEGKQSLDGENAFLIFKKYESKDTLCIWWKGKKPFMLSPENILQRLCKNIRRPETPCWQNWIKTVLRYALAPDNFSSFFPRMPIVRKENLIQNNK